MELGINYKIFAFGGNGGQTIEKLKDLDFSPERLYYFDTDKKAVTRCSISNKFQIGIDSLKGKGTTGDKAKGLEVFKTETHFFENFIREDCLYLILGGLWGGTFSGIAIPLIELLSKHNRRYVCATSYPFPFEKKERLANAINTIKEINEYTDKVILLNPNFWDNLDDLGGQTELFYEMSMKLADIVGDLLKSSSEGDSANQNLHQRTLLRAIELVRAYIHKNEYIVAQEDSRIIVAKNLQVLLQAFNEGVDITRNISPRKFEELVNYIYQVSGHATELTKPSRDNGIDIKVFSLPPGKKDNPFVTIVQAKQHDPKIKVGESAIRDLVGTVSIQKADRGQLVTNSDFSKPAINAAKVAKVDLIKFYELAQEAKSL